MFPAPVDRSVAEALRALPGVATSEGARPRDLFARAELHGVAGVLWDAWRQHGAVVDPDLALRLEAGEIAREMDCEAHLAMLHRIDGVLEVPTIALKGPLFARRYYTRPSARGTSDIDLLVSEEDLHVAVRSLAKADYHVVDSTEEVARSRREHHHLHLARPHSPELELHFHAYRGFGVTLRAHALAERSELASGFETIRVPDARDELVYLAVHAAAHRFGRLAWLHDLRLVVERMTNADLEVAAARAREWSVARALALAGELLVDVLGVSPDRARRLGTLPRARSALVHAVVAEPRARFFGAATRFVYTVMLSDTMAASMRYARWSSLGHARRLAGLLNHHGEPPRRESRGVD